MAGAQKKAARRAEQFNSEPEHGAGRIVARVIDARSGLRSFENIHAIRMNDEGVRRLFMNDYNPTLGQVIGDVALLREDGEVRFDSIRGFYKLQHNMFTLLIEAHLDKGSGK